MAGEYKKGSELKVELINKAGGIKRLELVVYDDQSSPGRLRVAQRLVSRMSHSHDRDCKRSHLRRCCIYGNRYKFYKYWFGLRLIPKDHFVNSAHKTILPWSVLLNI